MIHHLVSDPSLVTSGAYLVTILIDHNKESSCPGLQSALSAALYILSTHCQQVVMLCRPVR